jgi:transposase-like protein
MTQRSPLTPEEREKIVSLLKEGGLSQGAVARLVGRAQSTVSSVATQEGLSAPRHRTPVQAELCEKGVRQRATPRAPRQVSLPHRGPGKSGTDDSEGDEGAGASHGPRYREAPSRRRRGRVHYLDALRNPSRRDHQLGRRIRQA